MSSRIDYIFMSKNLCLEVTQANIGNILYSDHALLFVTWQWKISQKRPGIWSFNNLLLENPEIRQATEMEIKNFFSTDSGTADNITVWECLIAYICGVFISHTAYRLKKQQKELVDCIRM